MVQNARKIWLRVGAGRSDVLVIAFGFIGVQRRRRRCGHTAGPRFLSKAAFQAPVRSILDRFVDLFAKLVVALAEADSV